jgi:membrane-associated protein
MIFSISQLIALVLQYRYLILLPIAIVEGPIITIICGFLISAGQLNLLLVYAIVMVGDLVGDILWYYLGYYYGHPFIKKHGERFGITEEKVAIVEKNFHTYKHPILFFSKITNGLGFALVVLFTAGLSKIPFRRYMLINAVGQFIWSGMLLTAGYFFGNVFIHTKSIQGKLFMVSLAIVFVFFIIKYILQLRKKIIT